MDGKARRVFAVAGLVCLLWANRADCQSSGITNWQAVVAFPNLTFDDATMLVPMPRTNLLCVCGREGIIWTFPNSPAATNKAVFLNISARTQGSNTCGLLGMAFHPEFGLSTSTNRGYVYVYYSYSANPIASPPLATPTYDRLSRFTVPGGSSVADPNSELVLVNQFDRHIWLAGGAMFFGADGFLYFSNGDEGGDNDLYNTSQRLSNGLFSGLFRIDVNRDSTKSHPIRRQPLTAGTNSPLSFTANYFIPNDNPFLDPNGGVLEEYYAQGFRSPHRATFDAVTGRIWLGDVGENAWEEVNLVQRGGNYQWAYREGTDPGPKPTPSPILGTEQPPFYEYPHTLGNNCVIGGYVYRGSRFASSLGGQYLFGDNGSDRIWAMTYDGVNPPAVRELCTLPSTTAYSGLSSFGVDQNGEIYLCRIGVAQNLYMLVQTNTPATGLPAPWSNQDIGTVGLPGSASYANGVFTVSGSGFDIWDPRDAFQFAFQPWTGDGEIVARVTGVQETSLWAKAGVMFREVLLGGSRHALMLVSAGEGTGFQRRLVPDSTTTWTPGVFAGAPYWVRLVRRGNLFSAYGSSDGANWILADTDTIAMANTVYVGLAVTSHNDTALNTSTFTDVRISGPAPQLSLLSFDPSQGAFLQATGAIGQSYVFQASGNLSSWTSIGTVTNTSGTVGLLDRQATNQVRRFYRALVQN